MEDIEAVVKAGEGGSAGGGWGGRVRRAVCGCQEDDEEYYEEDEGAAGRGSGHGERMVGGDVDEEEIWMG